MKKITIKYSVFVTLAVLLGASCICASESKTLGQDILTNPNNRWKDLHLLPSQLIGSIILRNHPIVPFILDRLHVITTLKVPVMKRSAVFNDSEDTILTYSIYNAKLWEASNGKCLHILKEHADHVISAEFNGSGDMVLTASFDKTAKLWETSSGNCLHTLAGHTERVISAIFNVSGDKVLTASDDGTAKLWETSSGNCLHTLTGHSRGIHFLYGSRGVASAIFNVLGDMVLTTSCHNTAVKLWETSSGKCLHTLKGHTDNDTGSFTAAFNGSGDKVLTATNRDAKLWETSSGRCLHSLTTRTRSAPYSKSKFSNSGDLISTACSDGTVKLWDTNSGECFQTLKACNDHNIRTIVFNGSEDKVLTTTDKEGTAKLWETSSGLCLRTLRGHKDIILFAVFNGSGDRVLTASEDGTAKLWDTSSGECLKTLKGHTKRVRSAVFNGSEDMILTSSADGTAKLFDITLFSRLRSFFSRDDRISLNQAVVLIGVYEIIICRKLLRKTVSSHKLYFRRLKDTLKNLSSSTEGHAMSSDRVVFDFRICPHLQADYEKLPITVRRVLDEYVRKTPSKNDYSTASTSSTTSESILKGLL